MLLSATVLLAAVWAQDAPGGIPAAAPAATTGPGPARISPPPEGHRFSNGVTYVYKAEWKWWDAGVATLRIDRDSSGMQRVTATAKSIGFVGDRKSVV